LARVAGLDVEESPADRRYVTDLDRLEEYSATHAETFDELGNWQAERFEAAWESYLIRKALDDIERNRHDMTMALYSNGMIGGDALRNELDAIENHADALRRKVLGADVIEEEYEFSTEPPMPRDQSG